MTGAVSLEPILSSPPARPSPGPSLTVRTGAVLGQEDPSPAYIRTCRQFLVAAGTSQTVFTEGQFIQK